MDSHGIYWLMIRVNKVDDAQWPEGKLYLSGGDIIELIPIFEDGRSLFIRFLLKRYRGTWNAKAISPIFTTSKPPSNVNGIIIVYKGYIFPLLVCVMILSSLDKGLILMTSWLIILDVEVSSCLIISIIKNAEFQ